MLTYIYFKKDTTNMYINTPYMDGMGYIKKNLLELFFGCFFAESGDFPPYESTKFVSRSDCPSWN